MKGATGALVTYQRKDSSISIHAPMKGATYIFAVRFDVDFISIHAPMKGATNMASPTACTWPYFNPRTHEGCDFPYFSTHSVTSSYFNPRTHEGCDLFGSRFAV